MIFINKLIIQLKKIYNKNQILVLFRNLNYNKSWKKKTLKILLSCNYKIKTNKKETT